MAQQAGKKINMVISAKLVNLIEAEYVGSGKTDSEFATYASEKLGTHIVTSHVNHRRVALGITSNRDVAREVKSTDITALQDLVAALERRVTTLEFDLTKLQNPRK